MSYAIWKPFLTVVGVGEMNKYAEYGMITPHFQEENKKDGYISLHILRSNKIATT